MWRHRGLTSMAVRAQRSRVLALTTTSRRLPMLRPPPGTHGTTARRSDSNTHARESSRSGRLRTQPWVLACGIAALLVGVLISAADIDRDSGHDLLGLLKSAGRVSLSMRWQYTSPSRHCTCGDSNRRTFCGRYSTHARRDAARPARCSRSQHAHSGRCRCIRGHGALLHATWPSPSRSAWCRNGAECSRHPWQSDCSVDLGLGWSLARSSTAMISGPRPHASLGALLIGFMIGAAAGSAVPVPAGRLSLRFSSRCMCQRPHAVEEVLIFRVLTFWLPAVLGVLAARRLNRRRAL